jgi:hypothetical protein
MLAIGGGLDVALAAADFAQNYGYKLIGKLPDWVSAKVLFEMLRRYDVTDAVIY